MKQIGKELKEVREEKGISLEEVAEKTKIQPRFLKAIETGNWEDLPEEVYLRGFLRTYADALGLDGKEFVDSYNMSRAHEVPPSLPEEDEEEVSGQFLLLIIIVVLIGLGVIGFLVWHFLF